MNKYIQYTLLKGLLISGLAFLGWQESTLSAAEIQLAAYVEDDVSIPVSHTTKSTSPIIAIESPYDYETTMTNLKKSIAGRNFRLIRIQQLDHGFKDVTQGTRDTLVYFCNFNLVNKAIKIDQRIGQFLPCRITVHESNGKVYLMAINPEPIGALLGHSELKNICREVTAMYRELLEDVVI